MKNIIFADNLPTIDELTRLLAKEALRRADNDYKAASRMIGIPVLELARLSAAAMEKHFQGMGARNAV